MGGTMQKVVPLVFISAIVFAGASCSLFVDLDNLDDGSDASTIGATCDSGSCDGAVSNLDSSADAPANESGVVDAGINPCLSGNGSAGPRMIQADGYCIDSTEVTVAQYIQFVTDAGPATGFGQIPVCAWNVAFGPDTVGTADGRCTPANVDPALRADYPITCVNWCDAFAYCGWAGKRLCGAISGGSVPFNSFTTNAQWFLACASPQNDTYPNDSNDGGDCQLRKSGTAPVGTLGCNGSYAGLSDMVGNVEEWVDSCDTSGETPDGGGTSFDECHELGDDFENIFGGAVARRPTTITDPKRGPASASGAARNRL
jgi:sulfatase modifying factor 1